VISGAASFGLFPLCGTLPFPVFFTIFFSCSKQVPRPPWSFVFFPGLCRDASSSPVMDQRGVFGKDLETEVPTLDSLS